MVARESSHSNRMNPSDAENFSGEEEIVDYAVTADEFFAADDSSDEEIDSDDNATNNDKGEEGDDSSVNGAIEDGESDQENGDDDESVEDYPKVEDIHYLEDEELQRQKLANAGNSVVISGTDEPCSFDLRNFLAFSSYPMDSHQLYSPITAARAFVASPAKNEIIPRIQGVFQVNEDFLLQKSTMGCTQLVSALWKLPIERSDAGPLVTLPLHDDSKIPRSLVSKLLLPLYSVSNHASFLPSFCSPHHLQK
jgi:hypothetical protein